MNARPNQDGESRDLRTLHLIGGFSSLVTAILRASCTLNHVVWEADLGATSRRGFASLIASLV